MTLYRKKPVVVEAFKLSHRAVIKTLEGVMEASPGDYLIIGIEGELYPCKPHIFEQTYEEVDNDDTADDRDPQGPREDGGDVGIPERDRGGDEGTL